MVITTAAWSCLSGWASSTNLVTPLGRAAPTPHPLLGSDGGGGRSEDAPTQFKRCRKLSVAHSNCPVQSPSWHGCSPVLVVVASPPPSSFHVVIRKMIVPHTRILLSNSSEECVIKLQLWYKIPHTNLDKINRPNRRHLWKLQRSCHPPQDRTDQGSKSLHGPLCC